MTDWLELCRALVVDVDGVLRALPTREEREPVLRTGEGGDDTTAIDAAESRLPSRALPSRSRSWAS